MTPLTSPRPLVPRFRASTDEVAPPHRLEFWEAHNASALIGLKCSTHAPEGLDAREQNFDLGEVRITDIRGNQHVIERPRPMLSTHPKDSIFACVLLQGEAFFFQSGECLSLAAGDVIVYSTDIPYLYGFTREMRQLIVEVDAERLCRGGALARPKTAIKVDSRLRTGRLLAGALRSTALDFVERPYAAEAPRVAERARGLVEAVIAPGGQRPEHSDSAAWRLLRAETFIAEHLADPALDAERVARALSMSVRHLNRLFASRECSVTQWIWERRLERAHEELACPRLRLLSIGDIADRWGFASQAHFARVFKARFGRTPTQHRRESAVG